MSSNESGSMILRYTHRPTYGEYKSIIDDLAIEIVNKKFARGFCLDCSFNTYLGRSDYYMVHNKLWDTYGPEHGMLCLTCLEKRICRKLVYEDFTDCPLNKQNMHVRTLLIKKYNRPIKGFGTSSELLFRK